MRWPSAARALRTRIELAHEPSLWAALLGAGLLLAFAVALTLGAAAVPLAELPAALFDEGHPFHGVVAAIRLPRLVACAAVGAGLALAGALLQTVVRNELADPGLLGVTAGAGLAIVGGIILLPAFTLWLPLLGLGGGLMAVAVLLSFAAAGGSNADTLRIVLAGVALQAVFFAGIALLTFTFADRAPAFVAFTVGSLSGVGWHDLRLVAIPLAVGGAVALSLARPLDVLLLDEESAGSTGLDVRRARFVAAGAAALLAAGAVSVVGLVGFVGLVVPNALRLVVGPAHATLLPLSALGGALLLVVADTVARTVMAPLELPVGALLAALGGPYFLWLVGRNRP